MKKKPNQPTTAPKAKRRVSFATRLKEARLDSLFGCRELSGLAGLYPTHVANLERSDSAAGDEKITGKTLIALAEQLHVNPEWLLRGTGPKRGAVCATCRKEELK